MLQAQCWMLGTGPGIFPFFSWFPQVGRWGSMAPSCFDLGGGRFSPRRLKKKFLLNICSSPPFPHVVLWRRSEREREKFFFFLIFFKGAHYFSWNGMLETAHHWGLLAWDVLVFTSGWSSSNSTEVTGSALASSAPHWTQDQANCAKLLSENSNGSSSGPGHGQV